MRIVLGKNGEVDSGCVSELSLFCNYVSEKTLSIAVEPLQIARQLFSIDKWFVPRKKVTFYFMIVTVACLLGSLPWKRE